MKSSPRLYLGAYNSKFIIINIDMIVLDRIIIRKFIDHCRKRSPHFDRTISTREQLTSNSFLFSFRV